MCGSVFCGESIGHFAGIPAPVNLVLIAPKLTGKGTNQMSKNTFRVVTRGKDGSLKIRDYDEKEPLFRTHAQIGIEDSSTDLTLRGLPVFRGLIGPMPDGKNTVRYESPEVFESITKEWATTKPPRRTRRRSTRTTSSTEEPTTEA